MKEVLSEKNVRFAYVDITSGMGQLKQFLKLRDTMEVYAEVREQHYVGIPALFVDGEVHIIDSPEHMEQMIVSLDLLREDA